MVARGYGRIVNMSSQASVVGIVDHAVLLRHQRWRKSADARDGARVVEARLTSTPSAPPSSTRPAPPSASTTRVPPKRAAPHPMNKIGDISDVAGAVIYLASDAAKLVSGTCLLVDGAWTAQ